MGKHRNTIILGNGFLGNTFKRHGYTVLGRSEFDYPHNLRLFLEYLMDKKPKVLINTIGISDTRYCELRSNIKEVMLVNSELPRCLSKTCSDMGIKFVHISTGCLYDSKNGQVSETEFPTCHCVYTASKLLGEMGCDQDRDLIIRPRLLFDMVKWSKRNNLIQKLETFNQYLNEFNSVTSTETIVHAVEALIKKRESGIFNVANDGVYTIWEMARALGYTGEKIQEADLHKTHGLYLVNNVMDITKLKKYFHPNDTIDELIECKQLMNRSSR